MKIYTLYESTNRYGEADRRIGIFSSREKAEAYKQAKMANGGYGPGLSIGEQEIDPEYVPKPKFDAEPAFSSIGMRAIRARTKGPIPA